MLGHIHRQHAEEGFFIGCQALIIIHGADYSVDLQPKRYSLDSPKNVLEIICSMLDAELEDQRWLYDHDPENWGSFDPNPHLHDVHSELRSDLARWLAAGSEKHLSTMHALQEYIHLYVEEMIYTIVTEKTDLNMADLLSAKIISLMEEWRKNEK